MEMHPYQVAGIDKLALKARSGKRKLIFQLATGGGKTVCFSGLCNRFLGRNDKRIVILVHREELLKQARRTLFHWHEIVSAPIKAGTSYFPNARVYVAMVETANNRLKKNKNYFGDVGLVIVDECHIGNFKKLYSYFPNSFIIGFTATPVAATKRDPLNNYFDDIVCGIDIPDLIELWRKDHTQGLVPNRTINVHNVKRSQLAVKNGEFDDQEMSRVFSDTKHVQNCVAAYKRFCEGKKTLVFNCNIEHSKKVASAFQAFGYDVRHLDGETEEREREKTLLWFKHTPNAILCNVGVLTTGFDEPSILSVIVNKSTMSLPLWLQMTGRGSRPFPGKEEFLILDLGGNALVHGDWSDPRDWHDMFHNPPDPKSTGEAPTKECVGCSAVIHASQIICKFCGAENKKKVQYDGHKLSYQNYAGRRGPDIYVSDLVKANSKAVTKEGKPRSKFYPLHQIKTKITYHVKHSWRLRTVNEESAKYIMNIYQDHVREWCAVTGEKYSTWIQENTRRWMMQDLINVFNYQPRELVTQK